MNIQAIDIANSILRANADSDAALVAETDDDNGVRVWPEDRLAELLGYPPELQKVFASVFAKSWEFLVDWAEQKMCKQ